MSLLDQFVTLSDRKQDLERDLRGVKDDLGTLEQQLLDEFATEGVSSKRHTASGKLVHITRRIWARAAAGKADAAQALRAHGGELAEFVELGFNTQSLSSYFSEQAKRRADDHDPVTNLAQLVPVDLQSFIELTDTHSLRVRS
jgi:hypothetical protein